MISILRGGNNIKNYPPLQFLKVIYLNNSVFYSTWMTCKQITIKQIMCLLFQLSDRKLLQY